MTEAELQKMVYPLYQRMAVGFLQLCGGDGVSWQVSWARHHDAGESRPLSITEIPANHAQIWRWPTPTPNPEKETT